MVVNVSIFGLIEVLEPVLQISYLGACARLIVQVLWSFRAYVIKSRSILTLFYMGGSFRYMKGPEMAIFGQFFKIFEKFNVDSFFHR